MKKVHFVKTDFGTIAIIWSKEKAVAIERILIPLENHSVEERVQYEYNDLTFETDPLIETFAKDIEHFCKGEKVSFNLQILDMKHLTPFQKSVYETLAKTKSGQTLSYGELATLSGHFGASRAVGTAMKKNPFPLAIPCHRVICSDGSIGGFFGNIQMKKDLLKMEAIT